MLKEITVLGRGGQGGVTGAEILAEAAFFSRNYNYVSSFPTFGTERRGAPVQAFTRISDKKIWTRQHIYNPDIAIVLDETILTGAFLKSIKKGGLLIVNTDKSVADFINEYGISDDITVVTSNITHLCIKENLIVDGTPMVSTPILGVVGAVLKEIGVENVKKAIISHLGESKGEKNVKLAEMAAENFEIKEGKKSASEQASTDSFGSSGADYGDYGSLEERWKVSEPKDAYKKILASVQTPDIGEAGKTGSWRTLRPVINLDKCIVVKTGKDETCHLCWLYCPEATISRTNPPEINYDYCKGCGICSEECPHKAIEMIEE